MFVGDLLEALAAILLTVAAQLAFGTAAAFATAGVSVLWIAQGFAGTTLYADPEPSPNVETEVETR